MYLSYADYTDMGGTLDETAFYDYAFEAKSWIDWYTFGRLKKMDNGNLPEEVTRCMFRLIQLAKAKADAIGLVQHESESGSSSTTTGQTTIASQSNDGVSISYNIMSASEVFSLLNSKMGGNVVETTVQQYLSTVTDQFGRRLLYRGIYEDE